MMTAHGRLASRLLSSWSATASSDASAHEETVADEGRDSELGFSEIHARFARNVLGIYLAVSIVALAALVAALASDLQYQVRAVRESLSVETELRAQYLGRYLGLLADEVQRIGARPEIDLLDAELGPERTLLSSYGGNRAMFNRGFALLDDQGAVLWSNPPDLFSRTPPVTTASLQTLRSVTGVQMVPAATAPGLIMLASPIRREGQFTGALLGVLDLQAARAIDTGFGRHTGIDIQLSTTRGQVVFSTAPAAPAQLAGSLAASVQQGQPFLLTTADATPLDVAGAPVPRTDFVLLSSIEDQALRGPLVRRLLTRLTIGLVLLALPLVGASVMLRGSLQRFRDAEERAIRQERMRSLGEAASLIAHEVRNSLNSLRLGLDVVLSGEPAEQSARRATILSSLRHEMARLADFTTELLTFSRGVTPARTALDLASFTTRVVEAMRPRAETTRIHFEVRTHEGPLPVHADPTLLHVVLTNMLSNAFDFAEQNTAPAVSVTCGARGRTCWVRVSDNGPGVATAVRPRLFEPFVTGRSNGVGIGLALSRRIARAHGGDLSLLDAPSGALFELTLPGASS